ncbi:hypothetical protein ACFQ6S_23635 [Streptomyces sp. NPDC056479]|uniref:hypothetical protein n=1 Tax=Streptomyces sp. NPDC056479 TaxID=3345832 RepID=UPI0036810132
MGDPFGGTAPRSAWNGALGGNAAVGDHAADALAPGGEVLDQPGRLLAAGVDLIALGRPLLANPDLVRRPALGAPLNAVRDRYPMYTGGATGCTDHPALDDQPSSASMVAFDGPRVA